MLRARELRAYYEALLGNPAVMAHPSTHGYLAVDGARLLQVRRARRRALAVRAERAEQLRAEERRRLEPGRRHTILL